MNVAWWTPEHLGNLLIPMAVLAGADSVRLMFMADRRPLRQRSSWWWHMVFFMTSYTLVYALSGTAVLWGRDNPAFRWARFVVFGMAVAAFVWRNLIIRRTLRETDDVPDGTANGTERTEGTR